MIHNHLHIKTIAGTTQYVAAQRVSDSRHSYNTNKKTLHHIPELSDLRNQRHENLKS